MYMCVCTCNRKDWNVQDRTGSVYMHYKTGQAGEQKKRKERDIQAATCIYYTWMLDIHPANPDA